MPTDLDDSQTSSSRAAGDPMADHKQRARWRLIGAVVFCSASAALALVILRDTPRSLSQDFILQMPGQPEQAAAPSAPAMASATSSATSNVTSSNVTSSATVAATTTSAVPPTPAPATPVPAPLAKPEPEPKPAPQQEPKPEPKAESKPKPEPKAEAKPESTAAAKGPTKPEAASGGYFVQVGAHKTRAAAEAIQKRLQSAGHSVSVSETKNASGTWYRVRVGPFDSAGAKAFADRAKQQKYQVAIVPPVAR